jgi:hypothetical protein
MADYLPPVVQEFVATAAKYLDTMKDIIVAAEAASKANSDLVDNVDKLSAALVAFNAGDIGSKLVVVALTAEAVSKTISAANDQVSSMTRRLGSLNKRIDDVVLHLMALDDELDKKVAAFTGNAAAALLLSKAMDKLDDQVAGSTAAAARAGRGWTLWGVRATTAIHWIIAGTAELLAVLLPAAVAAGAWALVWVQGATNVYDHMRALFTATEALGQAAGHTYGEELGLTGAFQKMQNAANPDVYQALGAALLVVKETSGNLATVGLRVGQIFDRFMGRLVYDFSKAGGGAKQLHGLLSDMIPDLVEFGQIFGNLGHFIAAFAAQMPGLAMVLLKVLDIFTDLIKGIVDFTAHIGIGTRTILTLVIGFEEFNRWGSLLVGLFTRMGLGTVAVSGGFLTIGRASLVLRNLFMVIPNLIIAITANLGLLIGSMGAAGSAVEGMGLAMMTFAEEARVALLALEPWQILLITIATIGLGILIDKLVTAQTTAQKFGAALQQAVMKASDLNVLAVIGENLSKLQVKMNDSVAALNDMRSATDVYAATGEHFARTIYGQQAAYNSVQAAQAAYSKSQEQQILDAGRVIVGAQQIARAYHISIPAAMALAAQAGVSLTGVLKTQSGHWTALGEQVRAYVHGLQAMGASTGAVGADMEALAIQSGLAGTKIDAVNQAWDEFMQNLTGGTSGLAGLTTALQNIGQIAGTTAVESGKAVNGVTLSTQQFAESLKGFSATGSQAWTNFDQIVGSSAPQLIDWMRTATAEVGSGGKEFAQGVLDMIAPLIPLAARSRTAQAQLVGLARESGLGISTFHGLKAAIDKTGASARGLAGIVDGLTQQMGNMSQVAENLGTVVNDDVAQGFSAATLKAYGFQAAVTVLAQAIKTFGANSPQAENAALKINQIIGEVNHTLTVMPGLVANAQNALNSLHGRTIYMNTVFESSGSGSPTGGPLYGPGAPGHAGGGYGATITGQAPGIIGQAPGVTVVHQHIAGSLLAEHQMVRHVQAGLNRKKTRNGSTQLFLYGRKH